MKTKILFAGILCFIISSSFAQWNTQTVTNSGYSGEDSQIAIDSDGYPHIVHKEGDHLMHSYWNGLTWHTELIVGVSSSGYWGSSLNIHIGESNIIYVTYSWKNSVATAGVAYLYIKRPNDDWTSITSVAADSFSMDVTINNSSQDTIIHYSCNNNYHLYYITYNLSTSIINETLVDENFIGLGMNDIKIDNNENIHICYHDVAGQDLKYAFFNGTDWLITIVDGLNNGNMGNYCSIDVDINNEAHIAYYDDTNDQLLHVKISQ